VGTKLDPGEFDCYAKAGPDEPMFILLARDPLAPLLVRLWADLRAQAGGNQSQVNEARSCAAAMEMWRHTHDATRVEWIRSHRGRGHTIGATTIIACDRWECSCGSVLEMRDRV
jgi:hypothetical protein